MSDGRKGESMYIKGRLVSGQELEEIWALRRMCVPQLATENDANDLDDMMAIHGLAYCVEDESKAVACARLRYDGDCYTIDRLFKLPEETEDYLDFVLKMLIYQAVQHGAKEIEANVFEAQLPLFQKNRFRLLEANTENGGHCYAMRLEKADENHCCK